MSDANTTGARSPRPVSKARALREVTDSGKERAQLVAALAKVEATRNRRIVRAVALGVDKATVARAAGMTRARVGQIVEGAK